LQNISLINSNIMIRSYTLLHMLVAVIHIKKVAIYLPFNIHSRKRSQINWKIIFR